MAAQDSGLGRSSLAMVVGSQLIYRCDSVVAAGVRIAQRDDGMDTKKADADSRQQPRILLVVR
jgi:hypothetical protein